MQPCKHSVATACQPLRMVLVLKGGERAWTRPPSVLGPPARAPQGWPRDPDSHPELSGLRETVALRVNPGTVPWRAWSQVISPAGQESAATALERQPRRWGPRRLAAGTPQVAPRFRG